MLHKLSDRIFYMEHRDETDRPILGLISGTKYSMIVDSGNSPNHAKEFLKELEQVNIAPVKYLVLTHHHWDHVLGIKEMNLITIAHEKTKEELDKMKDLKWDDESMKEHIENEIFPKSAVECIKKEIEDRENLEIGEIDITYKDSLEIGLGGVTCIIRAIGGPHTDDSTMIYIPDEKTMFLGDSIYGRRCDGLYGYDRDKLFNMIEIIEEYNDVEYYIASHESLCDRKEINDFWNDLRVANEIVGDNKSNEDGIKKFIDKFNREPSEDEIFFINCFADMNKVKR